MNNQKRLEQAMKCLMNASACLNDVAQASALDSPSVTLTILEMQPAITDMVKGLERLRPEPRR